MRGAKGGFWDRILNWFRRFLFNKKKKEKNIYDSKKKKVNDSYKQETLKKVVEIQQKSKVENYNKKVGVNIKFINNNVFNKQKDIFQTEKVTNINFISKRKLNIIESKLENNKKEDKKYNVVNKDNNNNSIKAFLNTKNNNIIKKFNIIKNNFSINNIKNNKPGFFSTNVKKSQKKESKELNVFSNQINPIKKEDNKISSKINTNNEMYQDLIYINSIDLENKSNDYIINKLVIESKKQILKDKSVLFKIVDKVELLSTELNNTTNIEKFMKLKDMLNLLINDLEKIIENYDVLKNPSKTNLYKLGKDNIDLIVSKLNDEDIYNALNKYYSELDYYSIISNTKENILKLENKIESKNKIKPIKNKPSTELLNNIEQINNTINKKIQEQEKICTKFNQLVNNIKPEKIISTKYNFVNKMIDTAKGTIFSILSLHFLKSKKFHTTAMGLLLLNNSIRNLRKVLRNDQVIEYIINDDYYDQIQKSLDNFQFVDYMLNDSLYQIDSFKSKYINEFSEYSNANSFKENIKKIEDIEKQILSKKRQVLITNENTNSILDKNKRKIKIIKDMNK